MTLPPGIVKRNLQVLARQKLLLQLCQSVRLLLILQVPDRHLVLQRLIDAEEQVDHVLPVRIAKVVGKMAFDRCN